MILKVPPYMIVNWVIMLLGLYLCPKWYINTNYFSEQSRIPFTFCIVFAVSKKHAMEMSDFYHSCWVFI